MARGTPARRIHTTTLPIASKRRLQGKRRLGKRSLGKRRVGKRRLQRQHLPCPRQE
jgi:hypothetical protein